MGGTNVGGARYRGGPNGTGSLRTERSGPSRPKKAPGGPSGWATRAANQAHKGARPSGAEYRGGPNGTGSLTTERSGPRRPKKAPRGPAGWATRASTQALKGANLNVPSRRPRGTGTDLSKQDRKDIQTAGQKIRKWQSLSGEQQRAINKRRKAGNVEGATKLFERFSKDQQYREALRAAQGEKYGSATQNAGRQLLESKEGQDYLRRRRQWASDRFRSLDNRLARATGNAQQQLERSQLAIREHYRDTTRALAHISRDDRHVEEFTGVEHELRRVREARQAEHRLPGIQNTPPPLALSGIQDTPPPLELPGIQSTPPPLAPPGIQDTPPPLAAPASENVPAPLPLPNFDGSSFLE